MSSNGAASGFSLMQVNLFPFSQHWSNATDRYICIRETVWHHGILRSALQCPTRLLRRFEDTTGSLENLHLFLP